MSWILLASVVAALGLAVLLVGVRRSELAQLSRRLAERSRAIDRGSHAARLQYPHVDLTRCGGCGICIEACPEEGVLELIHGQAVVVHGARCVGHGLCARECPLDAITITLADLDERRDLPALEATLEARGVPGLFLAGEVTGHALVKTAIEQGTAVALEVAHRVGPRDRRAAGTNGKALDLCVVGAGPAGLACSLAARAAGLSCLTIDRESLGGTVAKYPRQKLVMTQPVELPGYGRLARSSYTKEELIAVWEEAVAANELPIRTGIEFLGTALEPDGLHRVRTSAGDLRARCVCVAIGRRGTPRRLEVPGEELPKVVYSLLDARSYSERDVLVVGGGDSAVEAALALAGRGENRITLSYRRSAFSRLKARNEERLQEASAAGRLQVLLESEVTRIAADRVEILLRGGEGERKVELPNDDVFVLAGGVPPFPMLEACGVSFDPADRPAVRTPAAQGTGLLRGLLVAFLLSLGVAAWVGAFADYYGLADEVRLDSPRHALLRPAGTVGLPLGIAAAVFLAVNLAYLVRRSPRIPFTRGSLRAWMTWHVATGILAFLLALVHGAMSPGDSVGGHAFLGLSVLVVTGAIGRYLYSFVPHAANGRELAIDEVRRELAAVSEEWTRLHAGFGEQALAIVRAVVPERRWTGSFLARAWSLLGTQSRVRGAIRRLREEGRRQGVPAGELDQFQVLTRQVQRNLLAASHFEELRTLLATWRWIHRWTALLVVLLVAIHVVAAVRFGSLFD
ncbi:MAG: NAD(P)-binding domain-containing protein [Planctomycetota bacterium]